MFLTKHSINKEKTKPVLSQYEFCLNELFQLFTIGQFI